MSNAKLSTYGTSSVAIKVERVSDWFKSIVGRQRIHIQMIQNIPLIWLDSNIDENNIDCRNAIAQFWCAANTINTFMDGEECIQFLKTANKEKVCIIIFGSLGQNYVPRVYDTSQVDSIFIFYSNKKYYKEWFKIKGISTGIASVHQALKQAAEQ